ALFAAWWMIHIKALTGNPLFPYFNEYWKSPLALAAPYRDLRFVPTHFWQQILFPFLFTFDWHVANDLSFQDIRAALVYLFVPIAAAVWLLGRENNDPLLDKRGTAILFTF